MAREYGVSVKAYNVSHEQIAFARERARAEGLSHRVEYIEDDYRAISGKFDVFVSVGMLEHVGLDHFQEFSEIIHRSIGDTGRGLLHFIGRNYPAVFSRWIRKHIFPGGFVPSLRQSLRVLEPKNYSVLDVENLRMHYAKTLEHWLERFEKSRHQVTAMYDSRFVRAWRLYLAGSIAAFRGGHLQLFQILFTRLATRADFLDARSAVCRRNRCCGRCRAGSREGPREGSMDACDVLIVGGGPAGSSCAWGLRGSGLDVAILDRQTFPRDKICGGWITPQVLSELGIDPAEYGRDRVLQPITGFRTGWIGGPALDTRLQRNGELRNPPARVRRLSLAPFGRAADGRRSRSRACSARTTAGLSTERSRRV